MARGKHKVPWFYVQFNPEHTKVLHVWLFVNATCSLPGLVLTSIVPHTLMVTAQDELGAYRLGWKRRGMLKEQAR